MKNAHIHLVKAALHAQFKTAMESCGVSTEYYFRRVNLPVEVNDPEIMLPLKPFYHLINIVAIDEKMPVLVVSSHKRPPGIKCCL